MFDIIQMAGPHQVVVARADQLGVVLREHVIRGFSDHFLASDAPKGLGRPIDQNVPAVARVFHEDRDWHIFDNQVEKFPVTIALLLRLPALSNVLVHCNPAAVRHRLVCDGNDPSVGKLHHLGLDFFFVEELGDLPVRIAFEGPVSADELGDIFIRVSFEGAGRLSKPQEIAQRAAGFYRFR